jgi:biopolymer transport protein TolQ
VGVNPIFSAYAASDLFGKLIFIALFGLSIMSWGLLVQKWWITRNARRMAQALRAALFVDPTQILQPRALKEWERRSTGVHPFLDMYRAIRQQAIELMRKNKGQAAGRPTLSADDVDLLAAQAEAARTSAAQKLEKHLFLLSTTVTLAPFLGLLGTVWGILLTFSQLQSHSMGGNQAVLGGLAMALATTVLGLVVAIPALIGYTAIKNSLRELDVDMEAFSTRVIATVEVQYRHVETMLP